MRVNQEVPWVSADIHNFMASLWLSCLRDRIEKGRYRCCSRHPGTRTRSFGAFGGSLSDVSGNRATNTCLWLQCVRRMRIFNKANDRHQLVSLTICGPYLVIRINRKQKSELRLIGRYVLFQKKLFLQPQRLHQLRFHPEGLARALRKQNSCQRKWHLHVLVIPIWYFPKRIKNLFIV